MLHRYLIILQIPCPANYLLVYFAFFTFTELQAATYIFEINCDVKIFLVVAVHCRKKCSTLKYCVHWNQGVIRA